MGVVAGIGYTEFPVQGEMLGCRVKVGFNYSGAELWGTIIRDDMEDPGRTIIQLDDGRVLLATECQYAINFTKTEPFKYRYLKTK